MKMWLFVVLLFPIAAMARTVATGTIVANPGATVSVPVTIDDMSGVAAAVVTVSYDSTVLVCLGVDAGTIVREGKFAYLDSGNGRIVAIFSGFEGDGTMGASRPSELMNIRFSVRDGTQGLFSDVTLADVQLGAEDGVSDLSVANPLTTVNGMVRVMAADAAVTRLENTFTVWPKTTLKTLALSAGDSIKASADQLPVTVTHDVTAAEAIPVSAPVGGWQTGRYALLKTLTAGLAFTIDGGAMGASRPTDGVEWSLAISVEGGMTTYYADVTVKGNVEIVAESGELPAETVAQMRTALAGMLDANPAVKSVTVKGDVSTIPVTVDLGIAPHLDVLGTTATATYATPTIRIIDFTPATGAVRIKVTPGEGNTIRSTLATGCIHVYGTSDLSQKMRYISGTAFDLTPYLNSETKGEADLTVSLGSHTFIKVKAEKSIKQEGEYEQ